jgi:hypothetical protein
VSNNVLERSDEARYNIYVIAEGLRDEAGWIVLTDKIDHVVLIGKVKYEVSFRSKRVILFGIIGRWKAWEFEILQRDAGTFIARIDEGGEVLEIEFIHW